MHLGHCSLFVVVIKTSQNELNVDVWFQNTVFFILDVIKLRITRHPLLHFYHKKSEIIFLVNLHQGFFKAGAARSLFMPVEDIKCT